MKANSAILLLVLLQLALSSSFDHLPFFEYCRAKDYPVEDHLVPTVDHYNLRFYRIQGTFFETQLKIAK